MTKEKTLCISLAAASMLFCAQVPAQQDAAEPIYRFDPALSIERPQPTISPAPQPLVVIDKQVQETTLRLQTESLISPYVGAERRPELSSEETRLLGERGERTLLGDYKLEAGVGLHVEDKTSLNLGYRFESPPSLLNERRNDPLSLSGDLRITFDVKVPF